jgi:hypothetical protein
MCMQRRDLKRLALLLVLIGMNTAGTSTSGPKTPVQVGVSYSEILPSEHPSVDNGTEHGDRSLLYEIGVYLYYC